jgi:hypothetical protein
MRKPEAPRVTIDTREDAMLLAPDVPADEADKMKKKRARNRSGLEKYLVGTVVFVPAKSWSDYSKKWPYPFALEVAYVKGKHE